MHQPPITEREKAAAKKMAAVAAQDNLNNMETFTAALIVLTAATQGIYQDMGVPDAETAAWRLMERVLEQALFTVAVNKLEEANKHVDQDQVGSGEPR